ncbi:MAG TPA: hypothetical protein VNV61_16265 [Steroidobacteraceae bacterium]|jgi:hypothetical protein|nr:hypothetical protein [Steroidobacteraceae bacterium]
MNTKSAGYSGTPLVKKLGIGANACVCAKYAPDTYIKLLEPLPSGVSFHVKPSESTDVVHVFVDRKRTLLKELSALRKTLRSSAIVWVSWPKKSSKVPTDITEDTIRETALPLGFVDIKVCAVTEVWSGLKLVVRKELR